MDILWLWVNSTFPQFVWIVVVAVIVWTMTKFYMATTQVIRDVPRIQTSLNRIDKGFTTLITLLLEAKVIQTSCYSESKSPRRVNDLGQRLLQESGAAQVISQIQNAFIKDLEAMNIDNPLELERSCLQSLLSSMNDNRFNDLQTFAYNHPTFHGKPLSYIDILNTMALVLRDVYLDMHSELIFEKQ